MLESERAKSITDENINRIFRITHTIKGSAAMMSFNTISSLAHSVEDMFFILRENPSRLNIVFNSIFDLVFKASDFFKRELERLQSGEYVECNASEIITQLTRQAAVTKGEKQPEKSSDVAKKIENCDTDYDLFGDGIANILLFLITTAK